MKDSTRGGMIFFVIFLALVVYFAIWMPGCESGNSGDNGKGGDGGSGGSKVMVKGQPAPDFTIQSIDGDTIKLSDFKGKKPVVLDFWATWCGPCKMEMPVLERYYKDHSDQMEILAITSESADMIGKIRSTSSELGATFPILHDTDSSISNMYPTNGIPFLVFIDKDGIVIDTHIGADPDIGAKISELFGL